MEKRKWQGILSGATVQVLTAPSMNDAGTCQIDWHTTDTRCSRWVHMERFMDDQEHAPSSLAQQWWALGRIINDIEEGLDEDAPETFDYEKIRTDDYDGSIEIDGVPADYRLTQKQSDWLKECGFAKIYANHVDGWETHYCPGSVYGWRRRYVSDPTATTTNVIAGRPNPGYFETNRFPKGFPADWLTSGYFRVVPDPLTPLPPEVEAAT